MDTEKIFKCPGCGETVENGWKFCPYCETGLQEQLCPKCNKAVEPDWKLCPFCGENLKDKVDSDDEQQTFLSGDMLSDFEEPATGIKFVYIPGGHFKMGDIHNEGLPDEKPVHDVKLDGFYMAVYPVVQKQWLQIIAANPSSFKGQDLPVEQVTWDAARQFVEKLTSISDSGFRFDLPTEAQWEYAARSGGRSQLWAGDGPVEQLAWIADNSQGCTQPVGGKQPNALGLYDMSGNVWEWCLDDYRSDAYEHHGLDNPVILEGGREKVLRGGAWHLDAWSARCARRFSLDAELTGPGVGLRIVALKI